MTALNRVSKVCDRTPRTKASAIYNSALGCADTLGRPQLELFLQESLAAASHLPCDLPEDVHHWHAWSADHAKTVASQYAHYLQERHRSGPRQFFNNKSHALYFLQHIAPTKLVDGAWLYSTLKHTPDWRYHGLVRTYLEELGDGDPALNHVVLYRNLLAEHDCAPDHPLDDNLYVQGAIQLALSALGDDYLPEMIGYNLGYEQLPLHLLISAFELNELDIDPFYFTLHVTIDNANCGHARKAVDTAITFLADAADRTRFLARLRNGYRLNELGNGSTAVIQSFDLEQEVIEMLERKRTFGQHMHSDFCRLNGKTVNEWLGVPGQSREFLTALEDKGWIKRHQPPQDSRFWQLVDGPGAVMFGVFSGYEKQLLGDWIAADWKPAPNTGAPFRAQFRQRRLHQQKRTLAEANTIAVQSLIEQMSPACHPTLEGLKATRIFSQHIAAGGGRP